MVTNGPHPRTKYPGGLPGGVPGGGLRGGSPGGWSPRVLRGPSRGAILGPVSHPLASNACICEALFLNSTHRCVCQTFRYFSFWPVIRSSYEHRVPAAADMLCTPTVQSTAWPRPPSHIYIVLHHLRPLICLHKYSRKIFVLLRQAIVRMSAFDDIPARFGCFPSLFQDAGTRMHVNFFHRFFVESRSWGPGCMTNTLSA